MSTPYFMKYSTSKCYTVDAAEVNRLKSSYNLKSNLTHYERKGTELTNIPEFDPGSTSLTEFNRLPV